MTGSARPQPRWRLGPALAVLLLMLPAVVAPAPAAPATPEGSTVIPLAPAVRPLSGVPDAPPAATPKEIELGNKAAAELAKDKKIKLLDPDKDAATRALYDKLNGLAAELGKVSARPLIKYDVKIINDDDINAFTLPNGHIYVYRGLLDFTDSDDEIASVLAHEIGHNARMHALRGEAKARKLSWISLATMVAALASARSGADMAAFSQYLLIGIMNGYGEEFEREADRAGIEELARTKYNPSAMVTFMQRLMLEERHRPDVEPGIFRTHPPSDERAAAALAAILDQGLEFKPREVTGGPQAVAKDLTDRSIVRFRGVTIFEFAPDPTAHDRALSSATQLNALLRTNLAMHEIHAEGDANSAHLVARGQDIARITAADAKLSNLTPLECARKQREAFARVFWREAFNGGL